MAATPKKLVHWALDASLTGFASPFSDASTSDSYSSTSSLQYLNSQLLAHGFTHGPGLSFDGLAKEDAEKTVKCILGMLSQRMEDMTRTEDLSTKLRTLSYDHERMAAMYKSEAERAANAERDTNMHKSRLTTATKSLQSSENAHKQTSAELQRMRTTLQALRNTHQTEIKKIEKEKERMVERWTKMSDAQLKVGSLRSGLTCVNAQVVEASDVQLRGKGQGYLDVALEQAETARKELFDQNRKLRGLILSTANQLQWLLHSVREAHTSEPVEEPTPFTLSTMFPGSPVESAGDTLSGLLQSISRVIKPDTLHDSRGSSSSSKALKVNENAEITRLQSVVDKLREELDNAQKQAAAAASQTQALFDRYAEDERLRASDAVGEMSVDLMTVPAQDEARQRLDARFKELEEERTKFTQAAVRLGREKAALEAERLQFLEEKRSWEVDKMLADLPPTPVASSESAYIMPVAGPSVPQLAMRQSPRKSPRKVRAGASKKTRISRRSSVLGPVSPKGKTKVTAAFETEVIPPPSPSRLPPTFKTSMAAPPLQPPLLTQAFVLPPPSPQASLPSNTAPLPLPPMPAFELPKPDFGARDNDTMDDSPPPSDTPPSSSNLAPPLPQAPKTPGGRPFPMAKPFAARMIHAYSPAKPSPLSRILMLANSPGSPNDPNASGSSSGSAPDISPTPTPGPGHPTVPPPPPAPVRSLAEELGVSEDEPPKPTAAKRKATEPPARVTRTAAPARDKGKGRADGRTRAAPAAAPEKEKENAKRARTSGGSKSSAEKKAPQPRPMGIAATRARASANANAGKPAAKSGPRRVPIGSAEAAQVPGWRG